MARTLITVFSVLLGIAPLVACGGDRPNGSQDDTASTIPADAISPGMSKAEAEEVLQELGLEYSFNEGLGRITAIQRGTSRSLFIREDTQLIITFDGARVVDVEQRLVYTGP